MNQCSLPHEHGQHEEKILEHMPGAEEIATVAEAMKQLGDPSRLADFLAPVPLRRMCGKYCRSGGYDQSRRLPPSAPFEGQRPDYQPKGRQRNVL